MGAMPSKIELTLTGAERSLIRRHGYPFPGIEAALDAVPASTDIAVITCDSWEVELLLGDLARSINDCRRANLQERLNDLYEEIESQAGVT
jgi:hypothetical protein